MITELLLRLIFNVVSFLLGFLPDSSQAGSVKNISTLVGYGVYLLGESFFTNFLGIITGLSSAFLVYVLVIFIYNKIRGC